MVGLAGDVTQMKPRVACVEGSEIHSKPKNLEYQILDQFSAIFSKDNTKSFSLDLQ